MVNSIPDGQSSHEFLVKDDLVQDVGHLLGIVYADDGPAQTQRHGVAFADIDDAIEEPVGAGGVGDHCALLVQRAEQQVRTHLHLHVLLLLGVDGLENSVWSHL